MYTVSGWFFGGYPMSEKKVKEASWLFLICVLVSQVLIYWVIMVGVSDRMLLQMLLQLFAVFPCVCYLYGQKVSIKEYLPIRNLSGVQWLLLLPLAFCVDKIALFMNLLSQLFTKNEVVGSMSEIVMQYPFPLALFVIAVAPAVCEELAYRGVFYKGYKQCGPWFAMVLSAFLFGIMHMDLNQFCYAFVLGILFLVINEAMGSFLPSVLLHFYINGRSVLLLYAVTGQLQALRRSYVAAEAVGDIEKMNHLTKLADGVPIHREDWLQVYLATDTTNISEELLLALPLFLAAVAGLILILWGMARKRGGMKTFCREIFLGTQTEGKQEKRSVLTLPLLFAVAFCLLFMFL